MARDTDHSGKSHRDAHPLPYATREAPAAGSDHAPLGVRDLRAGANEQVNSRAKGTR